VVGDLLAMPAVSEWYAKKALKSKATAALYLQSLSVYWRQWLQDRFSSIQKWLEFIKESQRNDDVRVAAF
jgi:biotin-(acetyl-CoA carboxylase) ligase